MKRRFAPWALSLGIVIVTLVFFYDSFFIGFSFDDWGDMVNTRHWSFVDAIKNLSPTSGNWRTVTYIFWRINYGIFGLQPLGYHLVHFSIHLLCVGLAWRMALKLTGSKGAAYFTAFLFSINRVVVTPVAWISATIDQKLMLFAAASVLVYLKIIERRPRHRYPVGHVLALTLFGWLALKSKLMGIMMPALYLAVELFFGQAAGGWRSRATAALNNWARVAWPLLILIAIYIPSYFRMYGDVPTEGEYGATPSPLNFLHSLGFYVGRAIGTGSMLGGAFGIALLLCAVIQRRKVAAFGLAWLVITIVPVAILRKHHFDHHMYLPLFGLCVAFSDILRSFVPAYERLLPGFLRSSRGLVFSLATGAFAVLYALAMWPRFETFVNWSAHNWKKSQVTLAQIEDAIPVMPTPVRILVWPPAGAALLYKGNSLKLEYDLMSADIDLRSFREEAEFEEAILASSAVENLVTLRYDSRTGNVDVAASFLGGVDVGLRSAAAVAEAGSFENRLHDGDFTDLEQRHWVGNAEADLQPGSVVLRARGIISQGVSGEALQGERFRLGVTAGSSGAPTGLFRLQAVWLPEGGWTETDAAGELLRQVQANHVRPGETPQRYHLELSKPDMAVRWLAVYFCNDGKAPIEISQARLERLDARSEPRGDG